MRVTVVSYAGDYREAFLRLSSGGPETYQAQRYSVDFLGSLPFDVAQVCAVAEAYDERLANGVRAIGAGLKPGFNSASLIPHLEGTDRLIMTSPMIPLLAWANSNKVRTITAMADSFRANGIRSRVRNYWLAWHLNRIDWVGNHQIPACRSLERIGVKPEKIIPWDWPPSHRPQEPRTLGEGPFKLLYVGSVCEAKGVEDLIRAVPSDISLSIAGPLSDPMPERENVTYLGTVPNNQIMSLMRSHDCVVVPSRHEYPEGLPLTITEALTARTPLILSDHPMFPDVGLTFPAGDVEALRAAIRHMLSDPELYNRLSVNSVRELEALHISVTFGEFIERWLADDRAWLSNHSLKAAFS